MRSSFDFTDSSGRRAWIKQLLGPINETKWSELAERLFAWQFARVEAYRRLSLAHDITPKNLVSWRDIPAVPQQLFKQTRLYAHGSVSPAAIYETSGTTTGRPGRQHLLRTDIYRAVSVAGARRAGILTAKVALHFLTPSPAEAPHSSLSAMFGFWRKIPAPTAAQFWVHRKRFDFERLREALERQVKAGMPVTICGTAFSFVHLIDAWADLPSLRLPRGSRAMETGGFKGRSREISKAELYAQLTRMLGVRDDAIWNEYGMSELSSQAYARGHDGVHQTPPWARVLIVNPATNHEVKVGERGLVRWIDLANTDSVPAVQTLDLAEKTSRGFRLLGRLPRTEPRGCSLSADDLVPETSAHTP